MGSRARAAGAALALVVLGLVAALAAPTVGDAAEGEGPITLPIGFGNPAEFDFGISPTRLPGRDPGGAELQLGVEEKPLAFGDGIPRGISEAKFGLDRSIRLEPGELPVCRWPAVEGGIQIDAAGASECPRAVVGRVEATVMFAYPENTPIRIPAVGKVYNGGARGRTTYLLVELPIGPIWIGTVRIVMPVRQTESGRIGSEATFKMPILGGGAGQLLNLDLHLRRGLAGDGRPGGYVYAECRGGTLSATLATTFSDGSRSTQFAFCACTSMQH